MKAAAIKATFADFQLVKSRKQARFIFEVPMEGADEALRMLGGIPMPDESRWVGIARLDLTQSGQDIVSTATPEAVRSDEQSREGAPSKPRRPFHTLPASQRAAILCGDKGFQDWLAHQGRKGEMLFPSVDECSGDDTTEWAAVMLRKRCGVFSRAQLDTNEAARKNFERVEEDFNIASGRVPAPR